MDLFLQLPLTDPAKKSLTGREVLKKLRPIASRPNMEAFDLAVGVDGRELFRPVRNWNNPNWSTEEDKMSKSMTLSLAAYW